jgi:hypothetical protein
MKILFNTFPNRTPSQNFKSKSVCPLLSAAESNFKNKAFINKILPSEYIANTNIKKIISEEEYDKTLNLLKNDQTWRTRWSIPCASKFEQGILPYAGEDDRSAVINIYMQNKHIVDPRFTDKITQEYIRVLDYALKEIDKVYGSYKGIVYRIGWFGDKPANYISTARDPEGLNAVITSKQDYHKPFSIIYTKHGHKIEEIQKKIGCLEYMRETEILLEPNTNYEVITTITPEMESLKQNLQKAIGNDYGRVPQLNTRFYKEI